MWIHNLNPNLIEIGPIQIRYYALMYIIGFVLAFFIITKLSKERKINLTKDQIIDYIVYIAFGAIIGARLFYTIVYNPSYYLAQPWKVLYIWQGGMSFHGGLIGATISGLWFIKKNKLNVREMADISVIPLAIGLVFGRIGNFINGELVGRVTDVPWCVKFPRFEGCRHPSQIYESIKNLFIFGTLWVLRNKDFKKGTLFSLFILLYSSLRFFIEFVREPDIQIGYIYGLTMGQILNIIMFLSGLGLLFYLNRNKS